MSLPIIFLGAGRNDINITIQTFLLGAAYWMYVLLYGSIFYLHNYLLFPRLYLGTHKIFYFLILILLGIAILVIKPFDAIMDLRENSNNQTRIITSPYTPPPMLPQNDMRQNIRHKLPRDSNFQNRPFNKRHQDIVGFVLYLLLIALGALIEGSKKLRNTQQQLLQTEAEKSKAELIFLKAQINPHFIFNTLNNIYSLAASESKETSEAILKLSGIMRYITDNTENTFVLFTDEIQCIDDYIYLQRLRLGKNAALNYTVSGNTEGKKIAPLILISFIENVFKYGISKHQHSPVKIDIAINNHTLTFNSENKIFRNNAEGTGLGIANTKKRLDLMYTEKYTLNIDKENNLFKVTLILKLNE
ncbi:hypothetical protein A9P82_00185 [Arachidicoccus ginsenosidimutans]|nr:hypothetical protein A9P82_00185 [Arachidicoccus sp. BS20]